MWDRQLKSEIKVCVTLGCLRRIIFLERSAGLFLNECRRTRRIGGESEERKKPPTQLIWVTRFKKIINAWKMIRVRFIEKTEKVKNVSI